MMYSYIFIVLILTLSVFSSSNTVSQEFKLKLDETLVIGKENSSNDAYLFGSIKSIKANDENIFVVDGSDNTVRVFDYGGIFVNKIGARGRGPGEFQEITAIEFGANNELVVLDRFQKRVTFFDNNGSLKKTESIEDNTQLTAQHVVYREQEKDFLISYRSYSGQSYENGSLFHLFDDSFGTKKAEHFNVYEAFFDAKEPLERRLSISPRYLTTIFGSDKIAVVPYVYSGKIGLMDMSSFEIHIAGEQKPLKEFYTAYDWNLREKYRNGKDIGYASMSGIGNKFFFKLEGINFGLVGNSKFLMLFYGMYEGSKLIPYVNIYDNTGELLKTIPLKKHRVKFINGEYFFIAPKYLDEQNNLYVSDYEYKGKFPAVRVFETNLDELLAN